uniref:Uncharacterized protein n=1 Tax=Anguilla anguilla TaxID=7936 RepID=A0A0E9WI38_ANGAN
MPVHEQLPDPQTTKIKSANSHGPTDTLSSWVFLWNGTRKLLLNSDPMCRNNKSIHIQKIKMRTYVIKAK